VPTRLPPWLSYSPESSGFQQQSLQYNFPSVSSAVILSGFLFHAPIFSTGFQNFVENEHLFSTLVTTMPVNQSSLPSR
jgi:hypothetical protein